MADDSLAWKGMEQACFCRESREHLSNQSRSWDILWDLGGWGSGGGLELDLIKRTKPKSQQHTQHQGHFHARQNGSDYDYDGHYGGDPPTLLTLETLDS